jgi:NAD(P)-dependent dehydrogenase (short-subunit alcohol dehydrogenase family)
MAMHGKVVVVTGGTQGIGLAAAEAIGRQGAHVILSARDSARGAAAAEKVRAAGAPRVDVVAADFSSFASIASFADGVLALAPRIDVLLNNAGAVYTDRKLSVDHHEMTFAVNHLGYFATTLRLLPALKAASNARVVSVSSSGHQAVRSVRFDDLKREAGYNGFLVYSESKLMNILFTRELARRAKPLVATCLHPGVIASGFGRNNSGFLGWATKLAAPLLMSTEKGAATSTYLCTSTDAASVVSGAYYAKSRAAKPSAAARDDAAAMRLWQLSEELTGLRLS